MKICIPVTSKDGLNSLISEHFGRAPHHIVVDLETMKHYALDKEESEAHGHCPPVQMLINMRWERFCAKALAGEHWATLLPTKSRCWYHSRTP